MRPLLCALLLALAACSDSGTGPDDPPALGSRENPAAIGQPVEVDARGFIGGTPATLRITQLALVSGEAAMDSALAANSFNDPPPAGYEYVLARFRVEVLTTDGGAYRMSTVDWESFHGDGGRVTADLFVAGLEPTLYGEGFEGASWEGWGYFAALPGDPGALAVFERGEEGETWFRLR